MTVRAATVVIIDGVSHELGGRRAKLIRRLVLDERLMPDDADTGKLTIHYSGESVKAVPEPLLKLV